MTEGWLYAGACGGLLVVAYLYYSLALDNNWTLFRLSKPHEPDHPDLPGHESGHPIGVEEEVAIDRATYAGTDYEGLEEQNRW